MRFFTEPEVIMDIWLTEYRRLIADPNFTLSDKQKENFLIKIQKVCLDNLPQWSLAQSIKSVGVIKSKKVFIKLENWLVEAQKLIRDDQRGDIEVERNEFGDVLSRIKPDSPSFRGHKAAGSIHKNE